MNEHITDFCAMMSTDLFLSHYRIYADRRLVHLRTIALENLSSVQIFIGGEFLREKKAGKV